MTLYSLRQKFCCLGVLLIDDVNYSDWLKEHEGLRDVLELEGTELLIYYLPDNLIRGHDKTEDFCKME